MKRLRLTGFGWVLLLMAVAVTVLALTGLDGPAWIVAIIGLLGVAATFMPSSARNNVQGRRFSSRR